MRNREGGTCERSQHVRLSQYNLLDIGVQRLVRSPDAHGGKVEEVVEHSIAFLTRGEGKQANELFGKRLDKMVIYGLGELQLTLWADVLKYDPSWEGEMRVCVSFGF